MAAITCILAIIIISLSAKEILALNISNRCPIFEEVGAINIDLEQYGGPWYDFMHSDSTFTCSLDVHSIFHNSSGYYFKLDYVSRAPNGSVFDVHDLADPSSIKVKGYTGYDGGSKYMNAFLDKDNDNYSIELACEESTEGPQYLLYALTRSMEKDNYVLQKLEDFNKKLGLSLSIKSYPDECKGLKL